MSSEHLAPADYRRIAAAIRYLDEHQPEQPDLETLAGQAGLSPGHFQRLFRRWAGISPKRYLQFLNVRRAGPLLAGDSSVADAAWSVGLSGPGRLHDHFVRIDAMSPGEYKARGRGLRLRWALHRSPFGAMVIAASDRGIGHLTFLDDAAPTRARAALEAAWPHAELVHDPAATAPLAARLFEPGPPGAPLSVHVHGTNFQIKVWEALLALPFGATTSYGELARALGRPGAGRAVGNAVGANPIAWLIPCHRVLRGDGSLGGYGLGTDRKRAMLAWEAAHRA